MQTALDLASKAAGKTSPNPMVGAVIVKNGRILGQGYHKRAGSDHAEIIALRQAGRKAKGATLYVTLEPCCHSGRTGPCAPKIIDAGLDRVVYATSDPDKRVRGRGGRMLRKAGIKVEAGLLKAEAELLNEAYFHFHKQNRPFVVLKLATTLDGRIATRSGESQWITCDKSQRYCHLLRSQVDAVMVGMGTARADNPSLTVRLVKGKNPYRIVVSSSMRLDKKCNLLRNNNDQRTILASTKATVEKLLKKPTGQPLTYWQVKSGRDKMISLADLMNKAARFGLQSILVEGGSKLATSLLKAKLVDKFVMIQAPKVLGKGIDAIGNLNIRALPDAIEMERMTHASLGRDIVITGYPKKVG
ncbi:MAG: bifunctional diaminohydroxyphosphoribosylaminopyrimidine deaminase/5-amino-6-(5-phosphoribosylamino)uracil reductase RibD [candidate division Zixibacteria bacterium]